MDTVTKLFITLRKYIDHTVSLFLDLSAGTLYNHLFTIQLFTRTIPLLGKDISIPPGLAVPLYHDCL